MTQQNELLSMIYLMYEKTNNNYIQLQNTSRFKDLIIDDHSINLSGAVTAHPFALIKLKIPAKL